MRRFQFLFCLALLLATLVLGACGQKGDLYLPDDPTPDRRSRG